MFAEQQLGSPGHHVPTSKGLCHCLLDGQSRQSGSVLRSKASRIAAGLAVGAVVEAVLIRLGQTYGSTREERAMRLLGDDIVPLPQVVTNHAIPIDAPSECVWPWLVQMGLHRGGWYTARWVDKLLFPLNWPSANRIIGGRPGLLEARFGVSNFDGGVGVGVVSVERCFVFVWAAHAQSSDDPLGVVPAFDPGEDRQFCVVSAGPAVPVEQLGFQGAEERFGHSVVV
jgi:hypothetical protein